MVNICGVSGSLRKASFNSALLRAVREIAAPEAEIAVADISDIPLYNGDVEAEGIPEPVERFGAAIQDAEALLIVTPEYNAGVPGVLKNALDWASRIRPNLFDGKPTAIMGASPGKLGTVRAQLQLRNQLANVNARVVAQPMIYVGGAGTYFGEGGTGLDKTTADFIRKQIAALIAMTP